MNEAEGHLLMVLLTPRNEEDKAWAIKESIKYLAKKKLIIPAASKGYKLTPATAKKLQKQFGVMIQDGER